MKDEDDKVTIECGSIVEVELCDNCSNFLWFWLFLTSVVAGTMTSFKAYDLIQDRQIYNCRKDKPYILIVDVKKEIKRVFGQMQI
eukprot:1748073-Ditylum_brightwellii.AAC.1